MTHPTILYLTRSHLSPLPGAIGTLLDAGPPYPRVLAVLPSKRLFLPEQTGRLFLDTLIRARPKWILEEFEFSGWPDEIWRKAYEGRFLPSWKMYKKDNEGWRAAFLRVLGRVEHRALGCTHEESWTVSQISYVIVGMKERERWTDEQRWITLHRNGSASINRFYSRTFDPYDIAAELK